AAPTTTSCATSSCRERWRRVARPSWSAPPRALATRPCRNGAAPGPGERAQRLVGARVAGHLPAPARPGHRRNQRSRGGHPTEADYYSRLAAIRYDQGRWHDALTATDRGLQL